jgi:CheY-like chemotaxis protein
VRDALDRRGYAVAGVGDGAPALDEIARVSPDLILLDLIMPRRFELNLEDTRR